MDGKTSDMWRNLMNRLSEMPINMDKQAFFRIISSWLKDYRPAIGEDIFHVYGLDYLSAIDASKLPLSYSDVDLEIERKQLVSVQPSSKDSIAMRLRDCLWALAVPKSGNSCPNCGDDNLRILHSQGTKQEFVFSCDICGWAQDEQGQKWEGGIARIATTEELRSSGLLK